MAKFFEVTHFNTYPELVNIEQLLKVNKEAGLRKYTYKSLIDGVEVGHIALVNTTNGLTYVKVLREVYEHNLQFNPNAYPNSFIFANITDDIDTIKKYFETRQKEQEYLKKIKQNQKLKVLQNKLSNLESQIEDNELIAILENTSYASKSIQEKIEILQELGYKVLEENNNG